MILLKGGVIRKEDEEVIKSKENEIKKKKLTFVLVYNKKNEDSFAYCHQIELFLSKFKIPYKEVVYEGQDGANFFNDYFGDEYSIVLAKPLPEDFLYEAVSGMNPANDPDCLTDFNLGEAINGGILPATAESVMRILDHYKIDVTGKKCLVIGRSKNVGFPIAMGLLKRNGLVSIAHSKVPLPLLEKEVSDSYLVVLASGKEGLIKKECFNKNQVVIDCGYHAETGHGDLGFIPDDGSLYAYTPVPGGVGPCTISTLIMNALRQKGIVLK